MTRSCRVPGLLNAQATMPALLVLCGLIGMAGTISPAAAATGTDGLAVPANAATARELPEVVVIGTAPLPGLGLPLEQVPTNVQTADSAQMQTQQTLGLADYLNDNFSGVSANDSQDNPFQTDVNYHGFTASPLLGTPEGLSVYVDGVRVNESFGDTVNWGLIPDNAISTVTLIAGSNPVFGLNTLGGALSVQTKSGHDNPGTELQIYGGSSGRRDFEAQTGGARGNFDYFVSAHDFDEDGWRDQSPSHVRQLFAKAGWQNENTDIDLSYSFADNSLIGNGAVPQSMLDYRREAIYSAPDRTHNHLNFINLTGTQFLGDTLLLSGNVYYRDLDTDSNNGDVNDDNYRSDEYSGPPIDCSAAPTSRADNAYCANGINRAARLSQHTTGAGLQLTETRDLSGAKNQAVIGTNVDHSRDRYAQGIQYATLTPERTAMSNLNPFNDAEPIGSLSGSNQIFGLYLTDTLSPSSLLHFTLSARYNTNTETLNGYSVNADLGDFGSGFDEPRVLTGRHTYSRVNPAFGFTVTPDPSLTVYADYNEASRAPTVIELGCADPDIPCGLPNEFASDPALKQVVARTVEAGARGQADGRALNWSVDVFHTINFDDIQFIATTTSEGYFDNVGATRRQGVDLALGGRQGALSWHAVYSFVDATYRSSFMVNGGSNSAADEEGNIQVRPGNRIPLIPRHTGRLVLDYTINRRWDAGASVIVSSGAFLHGNENNANVAGGTNAQGSTVGGSGRIGGYVRVNLRSTWHLSKVTDVFVSVVNLFDKDYTTAGFLTGNAFNADGSFRADPEDWSHENAVSPAQPRAIWAGVRMHLN